MKVIYRDWPLWRRLIWQNARASRGKVRLLQITVSCDAGDLFALVWRQAGTPMKFKSVAPAGANELTCSIWMEKVQGSWHLLRCPRDEMGAEWVCQLPRMPAVPLPLLVGAFAQNAWRRITCGYAGPDRFDQC